MFYDVQLVPFSGEVTNILAAKILPSQAGLKPLLQTLSRLGYSSNLDIMPFNTRYFCDAPLNEGLLDGSVRCHSQDGFKTFELPFSAGLLDGKLKEYTPDNGSTLIVGADFKSGQLDGTEEVYIAKTNKLFHRAHWKNGLADGTEEQFDVDNGNLIYRAEIRDGKYEGDMVRYAKNGKDVTYKVSFINNQKNGKEEKFSEDGKPIYTAEWDNGVQGGAFKQWDANGILIADKVIRDGKEVSPSLPVASAGQTKADMTTPAIEACVDTWLLAYRVESGKDAVVSADQMGEWESWCKEGKSPKP